ncbi:MAG: flagellar basal body rod protein FlgB [Oceanicaulis sp.]|nr:flagellar basal body rod protein FlgB [Oceanicaulis sp.]
MRSDDIPLMSMLREAMGFHAARQRTLAQNVANADTPGFTPSDLSRASFEQALEGRARPGAGLQRTDARHIEGQAGSQSRFRVERTPDSETTANGNSVVLEEQMARASETRMQYETAVSLYQKSLTMIRMAARGPGG